MKNYFREVAAFLGIMASLFIFITTFALAADDGAAGKKLFEAKCAQCHGKDGKGVAKMAKVLKVEPSVVDLTKADSAKVLESDMEKTVAAGKKKMPKFQGKLTTEQIASVVKYLKSLQAGEVKGK